MLSDTETGIQGSDWVRDDEVDEPTLHKPHATVSLPGSIVLLCACTMGAGLLAIPYTFMNVGLGFGSACLTIFGFYNFYAIWMLVDAGNRAKVRNYEELIAHAFPWGGRQIAAGFIMTVIFGSLVGFLIVSMVALLVIFPLSMMRNIGKLEYSSYAAVIIICAFAVFIVYFGGHNLAEGKVEWKNVTYINLKPEHVFSALPIISLAYGCQLNIFPVWKELDNPTVPRMNYVMLGNSIVAYLVYISVGVFGYLTYTTHVESNIILNLPNKELFYNIVRVLFALAITFHYPVIHYPFRLAVEALFFSRFQFSWIRHTIITAVTVGLTLVFAIVLPNLGKVFDLVGSFGAYPVNFILPVVAYIKIVYWDTATEGELASLMGREPPFSVKVRRLFRWAVVVPFIMAVVSTVSCVISVYMSIAAFFH